MPAPGRNNRANETVREKRIQDERDGNSPPKPFAGWHARGYLPHCDYPGLIQLVTFRLNDAMPAGLRREWEALNEDEDERRRRTRPEAFLDRGHGACYLRRPEIGKLVEESMLFHDAGRYRLCAWVVMPNHVHALIEQWGTPLAKVVYSWKRYSAARANRLLGLRGRFWQPEHWPWSSANGRHQWVTGNMQGKCLTRHAGGYLRSKNWDTFLANARG